MCAGSSNVKSRSVSLTFASTGRDSCFPAYSLSLSIISVFLVSPFARDQRRYLRDQGISPDRFVWDHSASIGIQDSFRRILSSPVKRLSRRLTTSPFHRRRAVLKSAWDDLVDRRRPRLRNDPLWFLRTLWHRHSCLCVLVTTTPELFIPLSFLRHDSQPTHARTKGFTAA